MATTKIIQHEICYNYYGVFNDLILCIVFNLCFMNNSQEFSIFFDTMLTASNLWDCDFKQCISCLHLMTIAACQHFRFG